MTEQLSNRFRERVKEMVVIPKDIYEKCLSHWDKSIRDSVDSINIRQLNNFCQDSGGLSREQILKKVNIKYVDKNDDGKGGVGSVKIDDLHENKKLKKVRKDGDSSILMGIDNSIDKDKSGTVNVKSAPKTVIVNNDPSIQSTLMRNVPVQTLLPRSTTTQTQSPLTANVSVGTDPISSVSTQTQSPLTTSVAVGTEPSSSVSTQTPSVLKRDVATETGALSTSVATQTERPTFLKRDVATETGDLTTSVATQTKTPKSYNVGTETDRLPSVEVQTEPMEKVTVGTHSEQPLDIEEEEDEYNWDDYPVLEGGFLRDPDYDYLDQVIADDIDSEGTDEYFTSKDEILSSIAPKLTADEYKLSFIDWEEIPSSDLSSDQVERLSDEHRNNLRYNEFQLRSDLRNRLRINRNRRRRLKRLRHSVIDRDLRRRTDTTTETDTPPRVATPVMENPVDEMLELQDELEKAERLEQQEADTVRDQDALERQQEEILASYDPEAMLPSEDPEFEVESEQRTKQVEQTKPIMLESLREEDPEKIRAMEVRHLSKLKRFRNKIDRFKREYGKLLSQYKKTPMSQSGRQRRRVLKKKMQKLRPLWREAVEDHKRLLRGADQKLLNVLNVKAKKTFDKNKIKNKIKNNEGKGRVGTRGKGKGKGKGKKSVKTIKENIRRRSGIRTRSKQMLDKGDKKKLVVLYDKDIEEIADITKRNKSKPDLTAGHFADYTNLSTKSRKKNNFDKRKADSESGGEPSKGLRGRKRKVSIGDEDEEQGTSSKLKKLGP